MHSPEYLFPVRRDFLKMAAVGAGTALVGGTASAKEPVTIGEGKTKFTLDENWGKLPEGMKFGLGCAIVVDSKDRIIVTSRSQNPCVAIFDSAGKLLETWNKEIADKIGFTTKEYADTAHGLYWSKEPAGEFLYWTENVSAPKGGKRIGARVYKTDMQGKVLHQIGNVAAESDTSAKFNLSNPTDVAIAPNGDIYVVDGYGSQLLHHFDKNFKLIKTIGGPGKDNDKFNTCHGVWVSTLKKEPELYVADRANGRLQVFSLELEYKRTIRDVRNPCCFYQHDGLLYVPDLQRRVTVFDADDKLVSQLGDGQGMKESDAATTPGKFYQPHALTLDSKGNLYILEWISYGRVRKFAKA
jgi:hypothetical protein